MEFESNLDAVLKMYKESKKQTLNNIGTFVTAEAQMRAPVGTSPYDHHKGNLRRCTTYGIPSDNEVDLGCTPEADYAPYVEKGTKKMKAEPFLEPAVMDNISKIEQIAGTSFKTNMSGE